MKRPSWRLERGTVGALLACALPVLGCARGTAAPAPKAPAAAPVLKASPKRESLDPLPRANEDFHVAYAAARAREQETLGGSRPYLALGEGKLVLRYRGQTDERSLASPRFDAVKQASHVAITALSAILAREEAPALRALGTRLRTIEPTLPTAPLGDALDAARAVVRASIELLDAALGSAPGEAELHAFGLRTRADTEKLLDAACDASLVTLDAAVRELRPRTGADWSRAVIVIATDHQSRAEEVGVQYFERLFHERAREGALGESRIVVLEAIGPNDGPLQAMASHLYDQRLSMLLFDDVTFLQGDVLGKHAEPTIARLLSSPF